MERHQSTGKKKEEIGERRPCGGDTGSEYKQPPGVPALWGHSKQQHQQQLQGVEYCVGAAPTVALKPKIVVELRGGGYQLTSVAAGILPPSRPILRSVDDQQQQRGAGSALPGVCLVAAGGVEEPVQSAQRCAHHQLQMRASAPVPIPVPASRAPHQGPLLAGPPVFIPLPVPASAMATTRAGIEQEATSSVRGEDSRRVEGAGENTLAAPTVAAPFAKLDGLVGEQQQRANGLGRREDGEEGKISSEGVVQDGICVPEPAGRQAGGLGKAASAVAVACDSQLPHQDQLPDRCSLGNPAILCRKGSQHPPRLEVAHDEVADDIGVCYRDCMRTLMSANGALFVDGCGQFMPATSSTSTQCAACGCHRSFHRRVVVQLEIPNNCVQRQGGLDHHLCASERASRDLAALSGVMVQQQHDAHSNSKSATPLANADRASILRSMVEALDYNAKMVVAVTATLSLIVKQGRPKPAELNFQQRDRAEQTSKAGMMEWLRAAGYRVVEQPPNQSHQEGHPVQTAAPDLEQPGTTATTEQKQLLPLASAPTETCSPSAEAFSCERQNSKRKRTKFSTEQREKLTAFAEKSGYTMAGQSKATIDEACADMGIAPTSLRYFIHNAKQKMKHQPDSGAQHQ